MILQNFVSFVSLAQKWLASSFNPNDPSNGYVDIYFGDHYSGCVYVYFVRQLIRANRARYGESSMIWL